MIIVPLGVAFGLIIASFCEALPSPAGGPVPSSENPKVDIIYEFPQTMSPENQYLRSNGQLLVTCISCNILSQLDPDLGPTQTRRTVYTFPDGVQNVLGIDELSEDVFAVATGQVNITNAAQLSSTNLTSLIQGPPAIWIVDLRGYQAPTYNSSNVQAYKAGGSNTGGLWDGLAVINAKKGLVATTDFIEGNIWLIDTQRNISTILVEQPVLHSSNGRPSSLVLANGMKYRDSNLYFTASQDGTYGYVPLNPHTGKQTGSVQVIYNYGFTVDDFNFGPTGNVYFSTLFRPNGGVLKRRAGTPNGQRGTHMPVSYFGTNSIIPRDVEGGGCELIITVINQFQLVKTRLAKPC